MRMPSLFKKNIFSFGLVIFLCSCMFSENSTLEISDRVEVNGSDNEMITVLSNSPNLLSAGDALIQLNLPVNTELKDLALYLNNTEITNILHRSGDNEILGLIDGLKIGKNTLKLVTKKGASREITLVNHPSGGPVFSGPQIKPWKCQNSAIDDQCNQEPTYTFEYVSTLLPNQLLPYNENAPPSDVAMVTVENGVMVPFIVRTETGYLNRDQYTIKTIYQPEESWSPWAPQAQWNKKLLVTHGSSCSSDRQTSTAPADETSVRATSMTALSRGFIVMSHALNNAGHNCNIVTQAESLVMTKERVVEQYGKVRFTIGTGTSGGSLTQQQVANAYPGIYQGVIVTASFQDAWSNATQIADYHLLNNYFTQIPNFNSPIVWTPDQMAAVHGHATVINGLLADNSLFKGVLDPSNPCAGVAQIELYDSLANPGGVRCSLQDYMVNVFSSRKIEKWTRQEKLIGNSFSGRAIDNIGVQYGLKVLQEGKITPEQFIDLNQNIGGLNIDGDFEAQRHEADLDALSNAYRSGAINQASQSNLVAIIDGRGPDPGIIHDSYRTYSLRARLDRAHGSHENHIIWEGPIPMYGDLFFLENAFFAMDRWLTSIEKDTTIDDLKNKIVVNRPIDLTDSCFNGLGIKLKSSLCGNQIVPIYGTPRTVAGEQITTDKNKCQLKELDFTDNYGRVPFTESQKNILREVFPNGVCDFSKPGFQQQPTIPWLTYQNPDGKVIYGGKKISFNTSYVAAGWAAKSFR